MADTFAYVGNSDGNDISVFRLDGNGEMSPVQTAPFVGIEKAGAATDLRNHP
jgi:6-phosphogluconolactonase